MAMIRYNRSGDGTLQQPAETNNSANDILERSAKTILSECKISQSLAQKVALRAKDTYLGTQHVGNGKP